MAAGREALLDDAVLFAAWKTSVTGAPAELRRIMAAALRAGRASIDMQAWVEWCVRHPGDPWRLQGDYLGRAWRDEPRGFPPVFAR